MFNIVVMQCDINDFDDQQFFSESEDEANSAPEELVSSENNLILQNESITASEIEILSNSRFYDLYEEIEETVPIEESEETHLCPYCGITTCNLNEHIITLHGRDKLIDDDTDNSEMGVNLKYPTKQHYCVYCKSLHTKLARHLERKHSNETDIKQIMKLPKGCRERKLLFAQVQKKGDFMYNSLCKETDARISVRRTISSKIVRLDVPCPYCQGFYSKQNIRNHVRLHCWAQHSDKVKKFETMGLTNLQTISRSVFPQIHEKASATLREKIFPVLNNDEVTRAIAQDELVITYANLLVMKYSSSSHHHKMIRNKMRHISRILLAMRKINPNVIDATSIFAPINFDSFIEAIHDLAGFKDGKFMAPSFGPASITLICQLGDVLQVEAIKKEDTMLQNKAKQFLKLVVTTASALITKTATENRTQTQRAKVVTLPKTEDVNRLYSCLKLELERCVEQLKKTFDYVTWTTLSKVVLIKLLIFNRKRPGDIERSQIVEYKNLQIIDNETLKQLESPQRKFASQFARYITRGKLDSPAAILVPTADREAIELLLKYRSEAKVDNANPYLFAASTGALDQYFKAGKALQDFCALTNLQGKNLTATKLRKHLATVTCTLNDEVVKRVSNFMGHSEKYHHNIYVQRPIINDVVEMGKVLSYAMGHESNNDLHNMKQREESALRQNCCEENDMLEPNNIGDEDFEPEMLRIWEESGNSNEIISKTTCTNERKSKSSRQSMGQRQETVLRQSSSEENGTSDEDFVPDLSRISEESDGNDMISKTTHKKKEKSKNDQFKIKKSRINKKSTWTTPERSVVRKTFKQFFAEENSIPSLETCQEFLHENDVLKTRTAIQVRSWILQEKKRLREGTRRWSTPVNELCRKHFERFYETETFPSTAELQDAIEHYSELSDVTVPKLRSHLQHDYKYLKRRKLF